jgi:alkaline phosphatase D
VIGQQLVMGSQKAAPEMVNFLAPDADARIRQFAQGAAQLASFGFEWNLDAWGGYPAARERLLAACQTQGVNALILGGDSHNSWAYNHGGGSNGRMRAIELAGTSVTSPGFEATFTNTGPGGREAAMAAANPDLAWSDLTHKGYMAVTLTRGAAIAEAVQYADVRSATATVTRTTRLSASASPQGPSGWSVG